MQSREIGSIVNLVRGYLVVLSMPGQKHELTALVDNDFGWHCPLVISRFYSFPLNLANSLEAIEPGATNYS
jgi:hypothetical protein